MNHVSQFLCIYLPSTVRERQKAEMAKEIAEGRSEYEREDTDADENRRAFWASKSKHTPGKFPFTFFVLTCSKYVNALTLLYQFTSTIPITCSTWVHAYYQLLLL